MKCDLIFILRGSLAAAAVTGEKLRCDLIRILLQNITENVQRPLMTFGGCWGCDSILHRFTREDGKITEECPFARGFYQNIN